MFSSLYSLNILSLKRQASRDKKARGISHAQALDNIAKSYGFSQWSSLMKGYTSEIRAWFDDSHVRVFNPYQYAATSVHHTLLHAFPHIYPVLMQQLSDFYESQGVWTPKLLIECMKEYPARYRKRKIQNKYAPCHILWIEKNKGYYHMGIPVFRTGVKLNERSPFYGHLRFRCPICGFIHLHGAGGSFKLGSGDGNRVPQCHGVPLPRYTFVLEEMRDTSLVGHFPKFIRHSIDIPPLG